MAITRSDFHQIPTSGVIPTDRVPASAFAVGFEFTYIGSPDLSNFNQAFNAHLKLHVLDSANTVKYVIDIQEQYALDIFPLAPGLVLFTWNWVPGAEIITGTVGDGPGAPAMTQLGTDESFGVDPASGSGTTDRDVTVDSIFYGALFEEALAEGDQLKIIFHNVSAGFVTDRASLLLATQPGAAIDTLRDERTGQTWTVYNAGTSAVCASTRRLEKFPLAARARVLPKTLSYVRLVRSGATLYALAGESGNLRVAASYDEGDNWKEIMPTIPGVTILASTENDTADTFYIYGVASAADLTNPAGAIQHGDIVKVLLVRASVREWKMQEKAKIAGDSLPTSAVVRLERKGATFRLYARAGDAMRILTSTDDLASFVELEALPA